jgi:flagellar hook-associated protein 1 FlgK
LYTTLVGNIGSSSALAQQQQTTQSSVTAGVDTQRTSVSGVNYDEEVSNMLTYQRAFQASSRVLTTLDGMLDTLINHTGLVGLS